MDKITKILRATENLSFTGRSGVGTYEAEKTLSQGITRVDKKALELAYILDPICFNSINQIMSTFLASDYKLTNAPARVITEFEDFLKEIEFNEYVLPNIVMHTCIYGSSFNELVYNKKGTNIVDIEPIDPKTMDYQKGMGEQILTDSKGLPVGYVQKIQSNNKQIKFPREDVAHIGLYFVGDQFYPVGVLEPVYKTTQRKMNIEEGLAQAAYRHGFPIMVAKLGDPSHEPSPQEIDNVLTKMKSMYYKTEMAVPYFYDIDLKEPAKLETYSEPMNYFIAQQISGIGVPRSYVTGSEETSNRAALTVQTMMFEKRIGWMQRHMGSQIEKQIFARISDLRGLKGYPQMEWQPSNLDSLTEKAQRLRIYADLGFISPDDVELANIIRDREQFPPLPKGFKLVKPKPPQQPPTTGKDKNANPQTEPGQD
jgi:hypothetical protein